MKLCMRSPSFQVVFAKLNMEVEASFFVLKFDDIGHIVVVKYFFTGLIRVEK